MSSEQIPDLAGCKHMAGQIATRPGFQRTIPGDTARLAAGLWRAIQHIEALESAPTRTESEHEDVLAGLPPDLARVLRDQSVIVPQDAAVFEKIAEWANAPSNTASADLCDTTSPCPRCGSYGHFVKDCPGGGPTMSVEHEGVPLLSLNDGSGIYCTPKNDVQPTHRAFPEPRAAALLAENARANAMQMQFEEGREILGETIADRDALRQQLADARTALGKYGRHLSAPKFCHSRGDTHCTCGLADALAASTPTTTSEGSGDE